MLTSPPLVPRHGGARGKTPQDMVYRECLAREFGGRTRFYLSAYDASFLELALREALPLATLDDDLLKAAKRVGVKRFSL